VLTYSIEWGDDKSDKAALAIIHTFTENIERVARKHGVYLESKAMNHAGYKQRVVESYGQANVAALKRISYSGEGGGFRAPGFGCSK
jgi:hypothetical protein